MENLCKDEFPTLKKLTSAEVLMIWDSVSEHVRQHLAEDMGVQLLGIGTFYVLKDYMCTVNGEVLLVRRPVFQMSRVIADECNLRYTEEDVPADVTVVPLRCEELSACAKLPFTTVQCCVYETVTSFFRATCKRQDTDFIFNAIGILSIRNRKVMMRFFDDFLLYVDGSEKLLKALLSNPERRHLVASSRETPDFRVGPGGVFVLPQFDFMLPREEEALFPSVGPLKATEDREEEKKEEKEKEGESPSAEHLHSQGKHSRSSSTVSGPKKQKGQKGKGRRAHGSSLPRIQDNLVTAEKDSKNKQTPDVRPQIRLPVLRSEKRTFQSHQETSLQARQSREPLREIQPCPPLPPTGKEGSPALFLHGGMVKRSWRLLKLNVPTSQSPGNLSSSSCLRREEFQVLRTGQLSMRANYILQLLETYHMLREQWSRSVELNRRRNYEGNSFFCIGRQMTLWNPRERYLFFQQNRGHANMMGGAGRPVPEERLMQPPSSP